MATTLKELKLERVGDKVCLIVGKSSVRDETELVEVREVRTVRLPGGRVKTHRKEMMVAKRTHMYEFPQAGREGHTKKGRLVITGSKEVLLEKGFVFESRSAAEKFVGANMRGVVLVG